MTLDSNRSMSSQRPNNGSSSLDSSPNGVNYQLDESSDDKIDGGYGWVVTACLAITNGHTWGINAAYSVFLAHFLEHDSFPGSSPLEYAFVGSLTVTCTFLISPLATIAARDFGTRPTMMAGSVMLSASLICASLSTKIWQLFLSQGVLFGMGMGFIFLPTFGLLSQWFRKRRALATGSAIAGGGLGGLTYSLSVEAMIQNIGLGWAFRILAIITFVVNISCTLLIKTRYKATGSRQLPFDISLIKRLDYILVIASGFFNMLGYWVLLYTLANYANTIGLNSSQASLIPAMLSLAQAIGRPLVGHFSDTIGYLNMSVLSNILTAIIALAVWTNAKTYGVLIFFALIEGLVVGAWWVTVGPVMADVIGLQNLPSGLSLLWLAMVVPCTFSTPIALEIVDQTGHYIGAQLFTGLVFVVSAVLALLLRGLKMKHSAKGDTASKGSQAAKYSLLKAFICHCVKWQKV
ncbi:hypothetical protein NM208_g4109 [Fusarium decemcellulare]|uniref:Uncharacterized protein n=1 Tax=Fusarium decemcellulare TaxID=57161 RepID=A0ACC1SM57_9HYPO|nr:hypothetical protein NM208_g4109 [Fusarium decemcellulare]